jgi:hypothetical protein
MYPTCVKKAKMFPTKVVFLSLSAVLLSGMATVSSSHAAPRAPEKETQIEAPIPGAITVSDYEFNTFAFPDVIKRVFFPAGSPVIGNPVYLSENTQVMLQFAKGYDKPIQMVAELENGHTVTLRVVPRPIPGITHAVNGARVHGNTVSPVMRRTTGEANTAGTSNGGDVELLKIVVVGGEPPAGFERVKLPALTNFDKFSVVPLAGWANGMGKRILVFSLVSVPGQTAVVSPPQFYRPGITAVMLDGDVVDAGNSPQLFVVEETNDE